MRPAIFLAITLAAPAASAHAFLVSSIPGVGATVAQAPGEVVITFTEGVIEARSTIAVTDVDGKRVDDGMAHLEGGDTKLAVILRAIPPGAYKVAWHATDGDGHRTQGKFLFMVTP